MDNLMTSNVFGTGKRLNLARTLRALRLKDIAGEFNVQEDTILKWQNRGVPKKFLPKLAYYFGVDEWVFSNEGLNEKEFQKIILDPQELGLMRPAFSMKGEWQQDKGTISSNQFDIKTEKLLIRAVVWGVEGKEYSTFSLTVQDYYRRKPTERLTIQKPQTLRVISNASTSAHDRVMGEKIVEHLKPQNYFLTIRTPKYFQVFVFELEQYTV